MNIQKYNALIKTIDEKSISKAAKSLGYSQSAVSKMILDLENEWNMKLINRNRNGIEPTSYCLEILEQIRHLVSDYDNLESSVASLHGQHRGTIRLGAPASISTNILPEILKLFHDDFPNIKIEIFDDEDSKISEYLMQGIVDVCVLAKPYSEKYLSYPLFTDSLVGVVPKDHHLAKEKVLPLSAFETENIIHLKEIGDYDINQFYDSNGIIPNTLYEVTDDSIMVSMVEQGLGICIDYALYLEPLRYQVVCLPLEKTKERQLDICVKNPDSLTPLIQSLIETVENYRANYKSLH